VFQTEVSRLRRILWPVKIFHLIVSRGTEISTIELRANSVWVDMWPPVISDR